MHLKCEESGTVLSLLIQLVFQVVNCEKLTCCNMDEYQNPNAPKRDCEETLLKDEFLYGQEVYTLNLNKTCEE